MYIVCDNIIIVLTMCNLTISSILQKPNKTATLQSARRTLACMVMKGLNSARVHCVFLIQSIKMH